MSTRTDEHEFVNISPSAEQLASSTKGPGEALRNARFALNLTEADIANRLRLSRRVIVALENENFEKLPGMTFVRGYLRSYARVVNLSGDDMIAKLDAMGYSEPDVVTPQPVANSSKPPTTFWGEKTIRYLSYGMGALLLLLVFLWWKGDGATDEIASPMDRSPAGETRADFDESASAADNESVDEMEVADSKQQAANETGNANVAKAATDKDESRS